MFKKIIKEQVEKGVYFKEINEISYTRDVGINDYGFLSDDNYIQNRQNIWYFSYDFEKILYDYKKSKELLKKKIPNDYKKSKGLLTKELFKKEIRPNEIMFLFFEHKNNLNDLCWIIKDYY
jgi:hypothetical protein